MRFPMSPRQAAWLPYKNEIRWIKTKRFLKKLFGIDYRQTVFGCPECVMPIDESLQKSNIRIERIQTINGSNNGNAIACYILSCPWCHHVMNIGNVDDIDKKFIIARKS